MTEPPSPLADLLRPRRPRPHRPGRGLLWGVAAATSLLAGGLGFAFFGLPEPLRALFTLLDDPGTPGGSGAPQAAVVEAGPPEPPPMATSAHFDRLDPLSVDALDLPDVHELRRPQRSPGGARLIVEAVELAATSTLLQIPWIDGAPRGRPRPVPAGPVPGDPGSATTATAPLHARGLAFAAPGGTHTHAWAERGGGRPDRIVVPGFPGDALPGRHPQDLAWHPTRPRFVASTQAGAVRGLELWEAGQVTSLPPAPPGHAEEPAWHPGGEHIAYVLRGEASSSIAELDLTTGLHRVVAAAPAEQHRAPTWDRAGRRLGFVSSHGAPPGGGALWTIAPRADPRPHRVARGVVPPSSGPAPFTPDGRWLLATLDSGRQPLCFFPVEPGRPRCFAAPGISEHRDPLLLVDGEVWTVVAVARPDGGDRNRLVVYTLEPLR